jgi:hypothetical protein
VVCGSRILCSFGFAELPANWRVDSFACPKEPSRDKHDFGINFNTASSPQANEPKKRAASDLFWDYHFFICPRITTRRPSSSLNSNACFIPTLRRFKNANLFPKNL